MMKKLSLFITACVISSLAANAQTVIKPYGALPTKAQQNWQDMEYYMFIHFGPNTFTDREWGQGNEDPRIFNPTALDARQWARTAKLAGMKGIIITAKHHDGFCLWPSKYSTHTVRESAWKNGKGDVLKELSAACKEYGLKFGVYLSPWDRNHPAYGTPEYNQVFVNMLNEVLGNYGPVFEQWFDGANGEGPNGKKQVYDWSLFNNTVLRKQPSAIIFSDIGPGCRWVGNEDGFAGTTNWSTINIAGYEPGKKAPSLTTLNTGQEDGEKWVPAECDVSVRAGWFYSDATNDKVKSLAELLEIYNASVGRNSNLLLNVPVDRRGRIHANDSTRLMEFRRLLDETYKTNLARKAKVSVTDTRKDNPAVNARNLVDGNNKTYWATPDNVTQGAITLEFPQPVSFNRIVLQEYTPLGQRVKAFTVEVWENGAFKEIAKETTIGHKRILRLPNTTTSKVKVLVADAKACPLISEVQLYQAPDLLASPEIKRDREGMVSISCASPDPELHYTTDGTEPVFSSPRYTQPFALPQGGVVTAKAFVDNGKKASPAVIAHMDISPAKWKVLFADGGQDNAGRAIDANEGSYWSTGHNASASYPHELQVDLGETLSLKGFAYTPHRDVHGNTGTFYKYAFYVSNDGKEWGQPVSAGAFGNIRNNPIRQVIRFNAPVSGRYIRIVALEPAEETDHNASIAELEVLTK
ncbi:alpha-L-fucosidase [Chitinophaga agrisoli]|nr:alpha-L-fucosidase [Chitinophaga agrisoli]